jgi:hypothetical protein
MKINNSKQPNPWCELSDRSKLVAFLQHMTTLSLCCISGCRQFTEREGHRAGGCVETRQVKVVALGDEIISVEF